MPSSDTSRRLRGLSVSLIAILAGQSSLVRSAEVHAIRSQLLYVPVYSEITYGDRRHTLNLSAAVTIRNTDRKRAIRVMRVDYFSTTGALVRSHQPAPESLAPLASRDYVISGADRAGGTSASFLLAWDSPEPVSPPLVEAVMIGAAATNGISFTSTPQVLEEQR
jgi:hypothetical protein